LSIRFWTTSPNAAHLPKSSHPCFVFLLDCKTTGVIELPQLWCPTLVDVRLHQFPFSAEDSPGSSSLQL
jgi:hypothetical protein